MEKKLVLYGSGEVGTQWLDYLGLDNVYAIADSNAQKIGQVISGKRIISVDELSAIKEDMAIFISTGYTYKREIYQLLTTKFLNEKVIGFPIFDKNVYLNWNTSVDTKTVFEGRNALQSGGQLYGCLIGFSSYIAANTVFCNVKVGRYTSVGPNVRVISGQHPTRKFVSTHPMFYSTQQAVRKSYVSKNLFDEYRYTKDGWTVEIGSDVWIGDGSTIMEGVSIADGTIVAAGANVVKDTEPYSIVGGNPARLIRYRFESEDIRFLKELKWWDKDETWIDEHAKYFDDINKLKNMQESVIE